MAAQSKRAVFRGTLCSGIKFLTRFLIVQHYSKCKGTSVFNIKNLGEAANKKIGKKIETARNLKWQIPKLCTNTNVFSYKLPEFPCASFLREDRYLQEAFNEYKKNDDSPWNIIIARE